jgi:hypothetical protein
MAHGESRREERGRVFWESRNAEERRDSLRKTGARMGGRAH